MPQINAIGARIFNMIIDAGFYIIMITSAIESLRHAVKGYFEGAVKSAIWGAASYAALRLIPILMEMMKGAF